MIWRIFMSNNKKSYLFDANYLILLFDNSDNTNEKHEAVKKDFQEKINDEDSKFFLTHLVRYEVLRGISWNNKKKLEVIDSRLSAFTMIELDQEIVDLARDLFRYERHCAQKEKRTAILDKRQFDVIHYACSTIRELEILSLDKDIDKIRLIHNKMKEEMQKITQN